MPNHNYQPDAPVGLDHRTRARLAGEFAAHWEPKGRGVEVAASAGWYFTGRTVALRELVAWSESLGSDTRLRVVTADPGSGKSALLGRLVLLSKPGTRLRLHVSGVPSYTIPQTGSVTAALLALGKTVAELEGELAEQLGLQPGQDLIQGIMARRKPALIVIDALEEATDPKRVIEDLIAPLQQGADTGVGPRLIVAARRSWVPFLPARRVEIDLDQPAFLGLSDVADYVCSVLLAADDPDSPTPYRDDPIEARYVAEQVAAVAGRSYLIAQIAARVLTHTPQILAPDRVQAELRGWVDAGRAFDADLARYGQQATRIRDLLLPLAWAQGAGLPRELWADVASAMAGRDYADGDIDWVLGVAGAYAAEAIDDDRAVYRLTHQELTEHLRTSHDPAQVNQAITTALLRKVPARPSPLERDWLASPAYVRTYMATHAAECGLLDDLVEDVGFLVAAAPDRLVPALGSVMSPEARRAASAYEAVTPVLDRSNPGRAAAQLQLASWQQGAHKLANSVDFFPYQLPWRVPWAHWSPEDRLILGRHTSSVTAVAVGQIGDRPVAVTGSSDATVRIWDLSTGQPLGDPLTEHADEVTAVAVGQIEGRPIAVTGSEDATVRIWDLTTGHARGEPLTGHTRGVRAVAVGQIDGDPVAVSASWDATVRVWDLTTGQARGEPLTGHTGEVTALGVSQIDGHPVAVIGSSDATVRIWDLTTGRPLGKPLTGHKDAVSAVAVGQIDGRPVAVTGSEDATVRIWDLTTGHARGDPLTGHTRGVRAVAVGQIDGDPVAVSASWDARVRVWDLTTGQARGAPLTGHTGELTALGVSQIDGHPVAVTGSTDATVGVWELNVGPPQGEPLTAHTFSVTAMALGQIDTRPVAVTGSWDATVRIRDLDTGELLGEPLIGHTDTVTAVALGQIDGRPVAVTGSIDRTLRTWDLPTRRPSGAPLTCHSGWVTAVAVAEIDRRPVAVSGGSDGLVRIWDLTTGRLRQEPLTGHGGGVSAVAVSQIDRHPVAVTCSWDGTVRIWDLMTGRPRGEPLVGHAGPVRAVAVSQIAGRPVALTGSDDHKVLVWDLETGHARGEPLTGHSGAVNAVAFSEIDRHPVAVTGSTDGTLRVWDLDTGALAEAINLHSVPSAIAATPDATTVISTRKGILAIKFGILQEAK
jgi:WD40 repeat protein